MTFQAIARIGGNLGCPVVGRSVPKTGGDRQDCHGFPAPFAGNPLAVLSVPGPGSYSPAFFHNSSTRRLTSASIPITPGHGRVNPSPGHLRVASMPIFDPQFAT